MNTFVKKAGFAVMLTLGLSTFAMALPADFAEKMASPSRPQADKDRDGTLDREEAKVVCKEDFDLMDKDRDGTLSKEELNACKGKKGKSGYKKGAKPA